jgi:hypothetical protein
MAILHRKEEKIQAVLGRLPKKYTDDQFVEMFIKLYSKDWGKIKSAYIKKNQDREAGTVVTMPKPELYLKQVLESYLATKAEASIEVEVTDAVVEETAPAKKAKVAPKKKVVEAGVTEEAPAKAVAKKAPAKKKTVETTTEEVLPTKEVKKKVKTTK